MGFVNENPGDPVRPEIVEFVNAISAQTGYLVNERTFDNHDDMINAMKKREIHMAWLYPLTYIYAHQYSFADVALLSNHYGLYFYGAQFIANIESGFSIYFDPVSNQNAADAATALKQFEGKRPCWIAPDSISGFIYPTSLLKQNDVSVMNGVLTQTPTAAVRALYIKGICDFAVTFALSGDPRTSLSVLSDLPDARERIPVIWQTDPVIPNLNLSFHPLVPEDVRTRLITALTDIIKTETGKAVLSAALNYDVQDLRVVDDSIYDPIRNALYELNLKPGDMIGR